MSFGPSTLSTYSPYAVDSAFSLIRKLGFNMDNINIDDALLVIKKILFYAHVLH